MQFVKEISPQAQRIQKEYNILASLVIAQACLESNFGQSGLAQKGHNLFGVKGQYKGESVTMATTEFKNGEPYRIQATFRKYPSWYESLCDLAVLYKNGVSWDPEKYHKIIGEKDFEKAARAVQAAGYCTDPSYAAKLLGIYKQNNLSQYDLIMWDGRPLSKGQIGRITILKPINLWKRDAKGELIRPEVKVLKLGEVLPVFAYDDAHGGQYRIGDNLWVTKMDGYIKYETPSKSLLEKV